MAHDQSEWIICRKGYGTASKIINGCWNFNVGWTNLGNASIYLDDERDDVILPDEGYWQIITHASDAPKKPEVDQKADDAMADQTMRELKEYGWY